MSLVAYELIAKICPSLLLWQRHHEIFIRIKYIFPTSKNFCTISWIFSRLTGKLWVLPQLRGQKRKIQASVGRPSAFISVLGQIYEWTGYVHAHLYFYVAKRGFRPIYNQFNLLQFHPAAGIMHQRGSIDRTMSSRNPNERGGTEGGRSCSSSCTSLSLSNNSR